MPRPKKVIEPEKAVDNTAPVQASQPVTSTQNINPTVAPDTSLASKPEKYVAPIDDYSVLECDGVKVRHFNPGGDAENMFKYLASQPKVPFYIPLGWGEKVGALQWAQMNDLAFQIEKNKMVEIPKPLADMLMESLKFTAEALNPFVVNGDGQIVRAQSGAHAKEVQK